VTKRSHVNPAAAIDAPKHAPQEVAETIVRGIAAGEEEVLVDELSRNVKASLSAA
jgi:hypothetical protein